MDAALLERLLAGETDRIEWKETTRDRDDFFPPVCALANDLGAAGPGYLVFGVTKTGAVAGVGPGSLDEQQQRLANWLRSTKMLPTPSCDVAVVHDGERDLLVVTVDPYPVPPVVAVDGVAWVRVGSTTRRATEADLARLRERRPEHLRPFDSRTVPTATLDDLETGDLRREYQAGRDANGAPETFPPFESWLGQPDREVGEYVHGRFTPRYVGLLIHGRSPQTLLPGAVIEFARYGGEDVSAPVVTRRTVSGTLPDQLDAIWALLAANLSDIPAVADGIRQPYAPEYPLNALKELARNLVQHRQYDATHAPARIEWYADRLEFSNPGGPFGRAGEGEFGTLSDYRNPLVTKALARLGYVEKLGRGIRLVRQWLQQNENPPLEVQTDGFTRLVVRRRT